MAWSNPNAPNVADFESYVLAETGATTAQLPSEAGDMVGRVTISASGSGITNISISASPSPTGDIATFTAVLANGSVSAVLITSPGSGYTVAPTLTTTVNAGAAAPSLFATLAPVYLEYALNYAVDRVLGGDEYAGLIPARDYILAVYQLALHWLVCWAPDPSASTVFTDARAKYAIFAFKGGVVASGSDSGTSASVTIPEGLKELPLEQLLQLKTPWGIAALSYLQKFGPNLFGIS